MRVDRDQLGTKRATRNQLGGPLRTVPVWFVSVFVGSEGCGLSTWR